MPHAELDPETGARGNQRLRRTRPQPVSKTDNSTIARDLLVYSAETLQRGRFAQPLRESRECTYHRRLIVDDSQLEEPT